jgi:tripeptide aminopeptidase
VGLGCRPGRRPASARALTVGMPASRVAELERRYLNGTFAELCRIESPSGGEHDCAERVVAELRALGAQVQEDRSGPLAGPGPAGLLARIAPVAAPEAGGPPPAGRPSVLLCAHLDTAPLRAPVEPVLLDGRWENANEGILGADNKAAVAVLLALARHVRREGAPVDVELLFTVSEQTAHPGARSFDAARLRSDFGYVFDHCSPIGEVIVASPSQFRMEAYFHGAAALAGARPQEGRSAILAAARAIASMQLGRLDEETTVNVGTIAGGEAMELVPERCSVVAEVRSLSDRGAQALVAEIVERVQAAANLPECECDVDVSVRRTSSGYRLPATTPALRAAEAALRACGHEPVRVPSGDISPANALQAQGIPTVNLANGTERSHEPGERVSVAALEGMLEVALVLLDEVAACSAGASV